jgi:glucose/arabinose dehydrogenase
VSLCQEIVTIRRTLPSGSVFLDICSAVDASGEGGLLGMAFDPGFPVVPEVYVSFTRTAMGAIVRLDIDGGSPYGIPAGNPFESNLVCKGGSGVLPCPEIYAWGLRNPWRFSFDTVTSLLWVGDVGQASWEEIDVIEPGGNYGWNSREGAHCFSPATGCADTFIEPITEYDHSLGASVTGGYVYRGTAISKLVGWYVFGDFGSGRIFGIEADSAVGVTPEVLDETGLQIVSFGRDVDGELYVLHFGGTIHQIADAP